MFFSTRATPLCLVFVFGFMIFVSPRFSGAEDLLNASLRGGKIEAGILGLQERLKDDPKDDAARGSLAVLQLVSAVEGMGQSWFRYGLHAPDSFSTLVPFLRLPVPENKKPEVIDYEKFRKVLIEFQNDLMVCEKTLSEIKDPSLKVPFYLGLAQLDLNADDEYTTGESLWRIWKQLTRDPRVNEKNSAEFYVMLDTGDFVWLQAYCHLLSGGLDAYLAYDATKQFNYTAQLYFPNVDSEIARMFSKYRNPHFWDDGFDFVALIHLIDYPVREPKRMKSAHGHFLQTVSLSRKMWEHYNAEMDDDHEWVPNAKQTSVLPNSRVTAEMYAQWMVFLDEFEAILQGKKLVPFWRGDRSQGVNIKRVFYEPKHFDLILWIQGSAAIPYLERGELTDPSFWRDLNRTFRGQFLGFAVWIN